MKTQHAWLWGAAIVAANWLVFFNALSSEFLNWDDQVLIFLNPHYQQSGAANLLHFWKQPYEYLYMPLTYTLWGVLANITRLSAPIHTAGIYSLLPPWPFHATNLIFHSINALLIFTLLKKLRINEAVPATGALLWSLHPLQVEAVCWASELKGVLCGSFVLAALHQYVSFVGADAGAKPQDNAHRYRSYILAALCFAGALLSKPSAVAMPLLAWIIDVGWLRREQPDRLRSATRAAAPLMVAAALWVLLAQRAQPITIAFWSPLWSRPFVAGDAILFYLTKIFWPVGLATDYGRTPQVALSQPIGYAAWLILTILGVLIWRTRNARLQTALAIFVAALLPNSGLVPFIYQATSTVADRYAYLALLGPVLGVCALLEWAASRFSLRAAGIVGALLIGLLAVQSTFQSLVWSNDVTLSTRVLQVNPRSYMAHTILTNAYLATARYDEALLHVQAALEIKPDDSVLLWDKAGILVKRGRGDDLMQGTEILKTLLRAQPDEPLLNLQLASALMRQGRAAEAVPYYRHCLKIAPSLPNVREKLATAMKQAHTKR